MTETRAGSWDPRVGRVSGGPFPSGIHCQVRRSSLLLRCTNIYRGSYNTVTSYSSSDSFSFKTCSAKSHWRKKTQKLILMVPDHGERRVGLRVEMSVSGKESALKSPESAIIHPGSRAYTRQLRGQQSPNKPVERIQPITPGTLAALWTSKRLRDDWTLTSPVCAKLQMPTNVDFKPVDNYIS